MRKHQQGMGMLGALVVIGLVISLGTVAVKLSPIYIDYWTLKGIIEDVVAEKSGGKNVSPAEVRGTLARHFTTNRIESIPLKEIEISSEKEGLVIDASYEKRTGLFFNIDAVVKFEDNRYVIPRS